MISLFHSVVSAKSVKTAAGAVETGLTAWQGVVNEAEEEATLSDAIVRKYSRLVFPIFDQKLIIMSRNGS